MLVRNFNLKDIKEYEDSTGVNILNFFNDISFSNLIELVKLGNGKCDDELACKIIEDYLSIPDNTLLSGILEIKEKLLGYGNNNEIDENIYKNSLEKEIADTLRELGKNVVAGSDVAGLSADLIFDKTIVEVDGLEDEPREKISNMRKQAILERSGFNVKRVSYREWQTSKKACIDRLLN